MASRHKTLITALVGTVALILAPITVAGASPGGGGTGITATPASTVNFDGGATSAQFVRSASGIINETNRVNLLGGSQNPWSTFDVWLQFRPLTGPSGLGLPVANPACDQSTIIPSFTWWNNNESLGGSATSGYFIDRNVYNVCVYYAYPFVLTVLANGSSSGVSYNGQSVTYSGSETNGSQPVTNDPVTLTLWGEHGCTGSSWTVQATTNLTGTYSYFAGNAGVGTYSIQASTKYAVSPCLNLTELPNYAMTLLVNGITSDTVTSGSSIEYSGTLTYNGVGLPNSQVSVNLYGSVNGGCAGNIVGSFSNVATTDGSGNYVWGPNSDTVAGNVGTWYLMATSAGATSNCVTVTVTS